MPDPIASSRDMLRMTRRPLIFTGAGVSAESGVPTFRGAGGLWKQYRPEQLATPQAFARDPRLVWEWYAWRRSLVRGCAPNAAHLALARLSAVNPATVLVTQNVDDLHERAGSPAIVKLHGSLFLDRCSRCDFSAPGGPVDAASEATLPRCRCGALLRPGVVWFGESLPPAELRRAEQAAHSCDAVLVVGTSGAVYPAAGIVHLARSAGAAVLVVDPEATAFDGIATVKLTGGAAGIVPRILPRHPLLRPGPTTPESARNRPAAGETPR